MELEALHDRRNHTADGLQGITHGLKMALCKLSGMSQRQAEGEKNHHG